VWHDYRNSNWDIYFQKYSSAGGAIGVNTIVNDDTENGFQLYPSIAMDVVGNFVIVWQDHRNIYGDIYFQRFTNTGAALGANIKVNDDIGNMNQKIPSISMNAVGDFVIVWIDNRYGQYNPDIFGQRYYSNGNPNGGNYRIVADGPNEGEISPVVCADNSNIIFSWQDNRRSEGWDIYAKIVSWNWGGVTTVVDEGNINPKDFILNQNYPNPFNPSSKIKYSIPLSVIARNGVTRQSDSEIASRSSSVRNDGTMNVTLKVYDVLGREVTTLVNEQQKPGYYEVEWDAGHHSSGVYFYRIKATPSGMQEGEFVETKKMMLLK